MNSQNDYIVADTLFLMHINLLKYEAEGVWVPAEEIRDINELLRLMGRQARRQVDELVRLREEIQLRQPRLNTPAKPNNICTVPAAATPAPPTAASRRCRIASMNMQLQSNS